jgi:DNA-binding MarR family transcriptional regulator
MTESDKLADIRKDAGDLAILLVRAGHSTLRAVGAELAPFQVSLNQYVVLARLAARGEISAGALAREIAIGSGAMTRLIDRMVQQRLIERHADGKDRRVVRLGLTSEGRRLFDALGDAALRVQTLLTQGMDSDEIDCFTHSLHTALLRTSLPQEGI